MTDERQPDPADDQDDRSGEVHEAPTPGTAVVDPQRHVPAAYEGTLAPNFYCRAWNPNRLKYCRKTAGAGTDHKGVGRCRQHGGVSGTTRHGRFSKVKREELRELIEHFERDPDPLNLLSELATMRALFVDYVNRYNAFSAALIAWHEDSTGEKAKPRQILDLADARHLVAESARIVERIERIRSANHISRADFYRLLNEIGVIVVEHVHDPATLEKIRAGIRALRL